jgi:hypothetical protein
MRTVIQALKNIAVLLLWFGGGYTLFFYVAHFSQVQSLILAGVALCAIDGYRVAMKVAEKTQPAFEPFWVRIQPNWYDLCQDFKLYDVANWKELQQKCGAANPAEYSVVRNGLNFTMLSPTLFYSNDHQTFFGELDFKMPAEEFKPEKSERMFGPFAPRFYVKRSLAGPKKNIPVIEFGLVTEESQKKSRYPADHEDEMPVASLPEIVFFAYMHPDSYNYDTMKKIEEQSNAQLAEFGWKQKERDPEDSWLNWPFEINHKYVQVTYRGIS